MAKQEGDAPSHSPGQEQSSSVALLRKAFSELEEQNEELRVAEEELRVQNETLEAAALALETERRRYRDLFHDAPDPSLLTDLNGMIQEANPAAHALLGVGPRSLKKKLLTSFIASDSRRTFYSQFLGQAKVQEREIYLQPRHSPILHASLRVSPVTDAGGSAVALRCLVRSVTPDPGAELARYRRLMAEVRDFAIFTMDSESRITSWNAGAEIIFGFSASEAIGLPANIIFTPEDRDAGAPEQERGQAAATGRAEDERWHIRKDGSRLWGSGILTALSDEAGGPPWYAKIVRDLTERRLHEQHEHTIATQLQASVQPAAPLSLPGLAVRTFYQPADKKLSVGGDFYDVFGLGDGRSVLAVGDVSGKGLDAASQVATVRNMLRFALYSSFQGDVPASSSKPKLVEPIKTLNKILTEHELLAGFVTLFVSVFDPATNTLTYINCGQESARIRRAASEQIEALPYTGALVGLDRSSDFKEAQVTLSAGDMLAIFTDGLTDIGPSRNQMLGEDGVTELLQGSLADLNGVSAQRAAEMAALRLQKAIGEHIPEHVPDDVCVLIAVAEENGIRDKAASGSERK